MSTINALSKVDAFNYKLNVYVVDRAIIVDRRKKIIEKTCKDVNKIIRANLSIVDLLRDSRIESNSWSSMYSIHQLSSDDFQIETYAINDVSLLAKRKQWLKMFEKIITTQRISFDIVIISMRVKIMSLNID